jgi:Carboxypeptidase regulatory-like domain/TonB dependent receptor/TonB-dependent Receptor Plug Domain
MRSGCRFVIFLCLAAAFAVTALAQFNASVQGTVTDVSGGAVQNAKVTLISKDTAKSESVKSDAEGIYHFSRLAPGQYDITVEAAGFKKAIREQIAVRAETPEGVNISLSPGDVAESITVSSDTVPALDTEEANVSRTLTRSEIEHLPQLNRDPYELVRLAPGVFGDGARNGGGNAVGLPNTTGPGGSNQSIFQTENQVAISANGQRLSDNNYMIDGVSVNSLTWGGAAVVTPSQESVKQITVLSEAYSAEYGRNSGAQILVVSQNGTNQIHGSGFFKYNDPGLNAFNKYGGPNGAPFVRVANRFRQYGGSLGGPIAKNKLFYFFSYEGLHNTTDVPYTAWVETPQFRQAVISARPNGKTAKVFQSPGVTPRATSVLSVPCQPLFAANICQQVAGGLDIGSLTGATNQYVDIGLNPTGGGLDGIPDIQFAQFSNPSRITDNQFNGRVDYIHGMDTFAFSTYLTPQDGTQADAAGRSRPMADLNNKPFNSAYALTYTRVFTPTMLNEARFNTTRFAWNQMATSSNVNWGIPRIEVEGLPFDRIRFGAPQSESTPAIFAQNTFEFRDTLSKVWGRHALKMGVEVRKEQNNNNLAGGARPLYSFQGLFNLANDTPIFEQLNADPNTGKPANAQRYLRTGLYALFLQDDFKLRRNFTLSLGLRWEYDPPLRETRGQLSNLFFGSNGLSNSSVKVTNQLYNPDRNNFAPRLGFTYSPTPFHDKAVLRGGFGVFYNRIPGSVFDNTHGNPPFFARYGICCGTATTSFSTPFDGGQIQYVLGTDNTVFSYPVNPALAVGIDPTTGAPQGPSHPNGPAVEIYMAQQNMPNPYVYVWSLDTEVQLPGRFVGTVGYQGSAGHKQIRLVNQNFLYPNNPAFFAVYAPMPDVNTNFNALLVSLSRRYSNGVQFATNYRFSKSIDTLSYEGPGFVTNQTYPQKQSTERGPSDFDARHNWNATMVYDLPLYRKQKGVIGKVLGGFSISTVLTYHTGFPWTPVTGQSVSTPGGPTLSPTRPVAYFGGAGHDTSNNAFIHLTNFAGGGGKYFDITHGGFPGIGRNSFRGPNFFGNDFSLMKQTKLPLGELGKLELRANLYNAFNKLNLQPLGFSTDQTHADNGNFGGSAGGLSGRVVELQARISF